MSWDSFSSFRNFAVPEFAMVPMSWTTSSYDIPMPLSRTVSVRGSSLGLDADVEIGRVHPELVVAEDVEAKLVQRV